MERKKPQANLKKHYTLFLQGGLIAVLAVFIIAMRVDLHNGKQEVDLTDEQEVVEMKEVVRTQQQKKPPPPPQPQVPVEVPNDEVIEDQDINLDSELNLDEPLPEPPKQEKQGDKEEEIFMAVEQNPEMIGGQKALYDELTPYPDKCRKAGVEGRVVLQFIVNKDGSIQDVDVIRGIGGGCDKAAVNAIKKMKFRPGLQRGNPVRVKYSWHLTFRLR